MYWHQYDILLLFNIIVFASSLCLTFPADFTKGRCPLDPRRGDHSNVVITPMDCQIIGKNAIYWVPKHHFFSSRGADPPGPPKLGTGVLSLTQKPHTPPGWPCLWLEPSNIKACGFRVRFLWAVKYNNHNRNRSRILLEPTKRCPTKPNEESVPGRDLPALPIKRASYNVP